VHGTDAGRSCSAPTSPLLAAADSGGVASYHPVLDQQSLRRLQLGTELEQAMADGQISVVFQPIIDAQTSDIVSVETLVRWATRATARSRPTTSSTSPSRSAGSARSPTTCSTSPWPAAGAGWTRTSRSRSR
jgi:hypothetical protein